MANLKFVFSNIRRAEPKKRVSSRVKISVVKSNYAEIADVTVPTKKKEMPLFYSHKIKAPEYEFF